MAEDYTPDAIVHLGSGRVEPPPEQQMSLADLAQTTRAKQAPKIAPMKQTTRGDDLMAKAESLSALTDDETEQGRLFMQSKQVIDAKMNEDPEYADRLMQKFSRLEGKELMDAFINESDQIQIQFLKENDPQHFTSAEAGKAGMINTMLFGQLTKVMGGAGALIQGRPYDEVVREFANKFRLMEKAFPGSNMAGQAAGFLMPGSPAKLLFEKVSQAGGKAMTALFTKIANNPKLMEKTVQMFGNAGFEAGEKILNAAVSNASGAGTYGFVKGTLGKDLQGLSLDRGAEEGMKDAAIGAGTTVALHGLGYGVKAAVKPIASYVQSMSGTSAKALRAYNANPGALSEAAGTEQEISEDIVAYLQNYKRSRLPESAQARTLLDNMNGEVDVNRMLSFMRSAPKNPKPSEVASWQKLSQWADYVEGQITQAGGKNGKVSPGALRDIIDDLQQVGFDADAPLVNAFLRNAQRKGNQALREFVKTQGGEISQNYTDLMGKAAEKHKIAKYLRAQMGFSKRGGVEDIEVITRKAERFVETMFGKNRQIQLQRMAQFDEKWGTNFVEKAEMAHYARELAPRGAPSEEVTGVPLWTSRHETGKASTGAIKGLFNLGVGASIGKMVGDPALGAAVGATVAVGNAAASSPRIGAAIIGASDRISGFVDYMLSNPKALEAVTKSGPPPVRAAAQEILNTLRRDGPISAAGVTRLVADSPFFLGLVHQFDLADKKRTGSARSGFISKKQSQSDTEIATPQTGPNGGVK